VLVDNNTADDSYVLVLDVYDHHSDRLIGKRLLTRKDFPKANGYCVFDFDFTPPSPQARMEFRIYYMGYSYIRADKIAVIDPAKISLSEASRILTTLKNPTPTLPAPWKVAKIGNGNGSVTDHTILKEEIDERKGSLEYNGMFTVEGQGSIGGNRDDFFFLYQEWSPGSGNGKIVAKFSQRDGLVAAMFRESLDPGSPFIMLERNRIVYREEQGGGISEASVPGVGSDGHGVKLFRYREGREQH
jgi:hypothetical protein